MQETATCRFHNTVNGYLKNTSIEEFRVLIPYLKLCSQTREHLSIALRNATRSCQLLTELNTVWVSKIINFSPKAPIY